MGCERRGLIRVVKYHRGALLVIRLPDYRMVEARLGSMILKKPDFVVTGF